MQEESESESAEDSEEDSNDSGLDTESKDQWMAICNESLEYKQY